MNSKLKPCPFCGGEAIWLKFNTGHYSVQCTNPLCKINPVSLSCFKTLDEAIKTWNTRAKVQQE